jgi:nitrite reductase/ring-hydroxylating ferredoxin subunit
MSHTVKVKSIQCKNVAALEAACNTLNLRIGAQTSVKLWQSQKVTGRPVELPGWKFPAVFNTEDGTVSFDNHNGHWGSEIELDKVIQQYAVECAKNEALMHGYSVEQEVLPNGDIKFAMVSY